MRNSLTHSPHSPSRDLSATGHNQTDFKSLISNFWNLLDSSSNNEMSDLEPKIEVSENKNSVMVAAELPGIEENDIDVQISSDGYLSISGEKRHEYEHNGKDNYFSEISYGTFSRTIPLPWDLNYEEANADYSDGVLKIDIPKTQNEKQKFKKISVKKNKKQSADK